MDSQTLFDKAKHLAKKYISTSNRIKNHYFLESFLKQLAKSDRRNHLVLKGGYLLSVGVAASITTSHSPLITNYRPSTYTIDYSNKVEDGIDFGDFYLRVHFFNEKFNYSISHFSFNLLNTNNIDYGTIDYNNIEYDILVGDLYICKDKTSNSISFDDYCDGVPQEGVVLD